MRTLLPDPPPPQLEKPLEELLAWRHETGADRHDEVWEGVLHMVPGPSFRHGRLQAQVLELLGPLARDRGLAATGTFNVGQKDDYRVPDGGLHRLPGDLYNPTAALVLEVLSSGDDTWEKLPFYAAHQVDEVVVVDPDGRSVWWAALGGDGTYHPVEQSALVDLGPDELAKGLDWGGQPE